MAAGDDPRPTCHRALEVGPPAVSMPASPLPPDPLTALEGLFFIWFRMMASLFSMSFSYGEEPSSKAPFSPGLIVLELVGDGGQG